MRLLRSVILLVYCLVEQFIIINKRIKIYGSRKARLSKIIRHGETS